MVPPSDPARTEATDLKDWFDRNAKGPLIWVVSTVLFLQVGYLAYLANAEYSAQIGRIERIVETTSLGIQQGNRPLVESTLIAGLHNADAAAVGLCREGRADLLYPPSTVDPCAAFPDGILRWTVRRKAVGMTDHEFVFVIDGRSTFSPLTVLSAITAFLFTAVLAIFLQARKRFYAEILDPLCHGLTGDRRLEIAELEELRRRNKEYLVLNRNQAVSEALVEISTQVAHDIRSPLAALDSILKDLSILPEGKRLLVRTAVSRIHDIANDLIGRNRVSSTLTGASAQATLPAPAEQASVELLLTHMDPILTEKRLQFRSKTGIEIEGRLDASSYGLFARFQPTEFKRALSNLVNNAVEALGEKGTVAVHLSRAEGQVVIRVSDDGKGIPAEILATCISTLLATRSAFLPQSPS